MFGVIFFISTSSYFPPRFVDSSHFCILLWTFYDVSCHLPYLSIYVLRHKINNVQCTNEHKFYERLVCYIFTTYLVTLVVMT